MQQRTALMFYLIIFILHTIVQALKIKIKVEAKLDTVVENKMT